MNHRDYAWVTVLLVAGVAFFGRSWEGGPVNDAVHYAAASKSIAVTDEWLLLQSQPGALYANKPPLLMWLTAINFKLFGISTSTTRFWCALFALLAALVTYLLGRDLFGRLAGLFAGCMSATFAAVMPNAANLRLDSAVVLATVCCAYATYSAHRSDRPQRLLWCGVAIGLGAMAKTITPVYGFLVILLFLAYFRPKWILHRGTGGAVLIAFAIAAPWHIAAAREGGHAFTEAYVDRQILPRLSIDSHVFKNAWDAIETLLLQGLPWWPLAAWTIYRARREEQPNRRITQLLVLWILGILLVMVIPPHSYKRYLMPAYPAVALLAGHAMARFFGEGRESQAHVLLHRVMMVCFAILLIFPIKIRAAGFDDYEQLASTLNVFDPGDRIAAVDPNYPTGLSTAERQWRLRTIAWYYMDRRLDTYATAEEAAKDGRMFLLNDEEYDNACTKAGYIKLQSLSKGRSFFVHRDFSPVLANARKPAPE